MRHVIRTSNAGTPIALERIELTRKEIVQSIVDAGRQYITFDAKLGSKNARGERIEEHVIVIEDVSDARVV